MTNEVSRVKTNNQVVSVYGTRMCWVSASTPLCFFLPLRFSASLLLLLLLPRLYRASGGQIWLWEVLNRVGIEDKLRKQSCTFFSTMRMRRKMLRRRRRRRSRRSRRWWRWGRRSSRRRAGCSSCCCCPHLFMHQIGNFDLIQFGLQHLNVLL